MRNGMEPCPHLRACGSCGRCETLLGVASSIPRFLNDMARDLIFPLRSLVVVVLYERR